MRIQQLLLSLILGTSLAFSLPSCGSDNPSTPEKPETPATPTTPENPNTPETPNTPDPQEPEIDFSKGFAKGADVSWLTELEDKGYKFYDAQGQQMDCLQLLKDECGINSIRLRVWVKPADKYNTKTDVLAKAKRAKALGLRLMIDFHFSDTWADPGQQAVPAEWKNYDIEQLKQAVTDHVTDVMQALKDADITPEWAQIGNETADGFMYPLGKIGENPANFAALVTAGHKAVKAIFPDCTTIVHTDSGDNKWRYEYVFGTLQKYNGEYDMIGVSFYPSVANWKTEAASLISNLKTYGKAYGKPTMVCEIGLQAEAVKASTEMMYYVVENCQGGVSDGVFYWEPEAPVGFNGGYDKGCFIDGKPTTALDCFK